LETGIWAEKYTTYLLFAAFTNISFVFSFITYLFIEAPFANIVNEFVRAKSPDENI
jgi:peptidoglycan/LPS O-acetylase OafA/YrhL